MPDTIAFKLNDKPVQLDVDGNRPLLWVLRTNLGLTGTKFGCGAGFCGALACCGSGFCGSGLCCSGLCCSDLGASAFAVSVFAGLGVGLKPARTVPCGAGAS